MHKVSKQTELPGFLREVVENSLFEVHVSNESTDIESVSYLLVASVVS